MNMIEKVARVIEPSFDVKCFIPNCPECDRIRQNAKNKAKAAILAMREPSEGMKEFALPDPGSGGPDYGYETEVWQNMIDAALKEE